MTMQAFTKNFADNSTEAGFQFTFYCDICHDGYKTAFVESATYKKRGLLRMFGDAASLLGSLTGSTNIGNTIERGANNISTRFNGMSPEWQKEHDAAFEAAQQEALGHFMRCPHCRAYVCETDWNEQSGLCVKCAPRVNVEIAAAHAGKMAQDIRAAAKTAQVFSGRIENLQTLCPACGKPSGTGKFCANCGASLALNKCPACGAQAQQGAQFCGECGHKL